MICQNSTENPMGPGRRARNRDENMAEMRKTTEQLRQELEQQQEYERQQRALARERQRTNRELQKVNKRAERATALRAARDTGYTGPIIVLNGKPYGVTYEERPAEIVRRAPVRSASVPAYTRNTVNGIPIIKIYRGYLGDYNAVARANPNGGLIWGRDYDMREGTWQAADYNLTPRQINELSYGMECIVDNGEYDAGTVVKKRAPKAANTKARRTTSAPKKPSAKKVAPKKPATKKPATKKPATKASSASKKPAARSANMKPAASKKPAAKAASASVKKPAAKKSAGCRTGKR